MDATALAPLPIFGCLSEQQLHVLAPEAVEMAVPRGTRLLLDGLFAYELLVIAGGRAQVRLAGEWIAVLARGDVFGALGRAPATYATATVVAIEDMTLVAISGSALRHLRRSAPAIVAALVGFIGDFDSDSGETDYAPAAAVNIRMRSSTCVSPRASKVSVAAV